MCIIAFCWAHCFYRRQPAVFFAAWCEQTALCPMFSCTEGQSGVPKFPVYSRSQIGSFWTVVCSQVMCSPANSGSTFPLQHPQSQRDEAEALSQNNFWCLRFLLRVASVCACLSRDEKNGACCRSSQDERKRCGAIERQAIFENFVSRAQKQTHLAAIKD